MKFAHGSTLRRREFLGAGVACLACGQAQAVTSDRIVDVHFHIFPPTFLETAPPEANLLRSNRKIMDWSPAAALQDMDRRGVARAILSFPTPSMWSTDREAQRRLARMTNDYFVERVREHPDRFGVFASLPPLTDVDGALEEIHRSLDVLHADGVRVMTSYQDRWLGDAAFEPVWKELDRRAAIVFIHPDVADCCRNLGNVPYGTVELPLDTPRTAANLWYNGVLQRYPNIRFILSHGGGGLPMVAGRLDVFGRPGGPDGSLISDALQSFGRVYVDTANATTAPALAGLRALVGPSRILFGTDAPFVDLRPQIEALRAARFSSADLRAIFRGNAERLLGSTARRRGPPTAR